VQNQTGLFAGATHNDSFTLKARASGWSSWRKADQDVRNGREFSSIPGATPRKTLKQQGKGGWYKQVAHADELSSGRRPAEKLNRPDFDTPASGAIQTMVKAVGKVTKKRTLWLQLTGVMAERSYGKYQP
jgi:hypothetical protein